MSLADNTFIEMCKDILENGTSTEGEKVRPHWEDGAPAYTIKKFGVVNRYDLSKEFPLITLRKTALKSATDEMLWIWQQKSNNINDLHSHIWDEWADENGNVAPLTYGAGLGYSFMNHFYGRIREDLRPDVEHWHVFTNENKGDNVYSSIIEEVGQGGADVVYSATGWPGHTAFIDPGVKEFHADSLEEFIKLGSRVTTESPLTICENSLFAPMGASGDVWAVPPRAATIGPRDIVNARDRFEVHSFTNPGGDSWQRMISRLCTHGPITPYLPSTMLQTKKTQVYISEELAAPFECWEKVGY